MADYEYCGACEELRERDPNLIVNGFSEKNCDSMQVDEGLNGDTNDFEDLNTMNDCLIGIMDAESEVRDVCGWREYIQNFIPNLWTMLKAMICAIGGLWTAVKSYQLEEDDGDIVLTAWDGEHGRVEGGGGTTYELSGSGSTVTLNGSDGSQSSYTLPSVSGGVMMQRITLPASTVATNTTKTISHAVWPSGTNRKIIGVVGYNFNDETPDTPGTAGVAHFNVFAIEPHSQDDLSVYVQFRNESSNNVAYILSFTILYIETE